MPKKAGTPTKYAEKEIYWTWYSIAPILRMRSVAELDTMGIADPLVRNLMEIKNQKDFMKKYKISQATASKWNKEFSERPMRERFSWLRTLTGNVLISMYRKAIAEGDAPRVKLWAQLVEDWTEKSEVDNPGGIEAMKEQNEILRKIAERK